MILRNHTTLIFTFVLGFFLASSVYAATDSFIVSLTVTDDDTPPSTPTGLTATPVSTSQIDLTWSSSTDNNAVTGYHVFRDGLQVATTTNTNYSDTGLSAATLYTYFVRAFDAAFNTSSSSASVATTTLALAQTPIPPGGTSGGSTFPKLVYLEIIPGVTSAVITWRTEDYARTTLRWGETVSYELGANVGQFFKTEHQTILFDLKPDTKYYFLIEGENGYGREAILTTSAFVTLPPVDVFPPANVQNLKAIRDGQDDILLTWENPAADDFDRVRILGNGSFYPSDIADGEFVYEGNRERAIDIGKAIPNTIRFYTVFSYDTRGNISSGAIVAIRIDEEGNVHVYDVDEVPLAPEEMLISLSLDDFIFEQDGQILSFEDGQVRIDGAKLLRISLPYEVVPEHLKSIVMTLRNASGEKFSFLLRVNDDRTLYTASVAPLGISGEFPFTASVFDFSIRKVAEIRGAVISEITNFQRENIMDVLLRYGYLPYFILLLVVLIWIGIRLIKRGQPHVA